jgi:MFS family permease
MKPSTITQHDETVSQPSVNGDIASHDVSHPPSWANWRLIANTIIIGCSFGLFGYDNNFAAPLVALPLFIAKYQGVAIAFTARNLNLVISVPLVGAALGTFVAAPSMKYMGRKKTFLLAYFLFCTPGSILQLCAPNIAALVIGRFWNCEFC